MSKRKLKTNNTKIYSGSLNQCDWTTSTFKTDKFFYYDQIEKIQLELENKLYYPNPNTLNWANMFLNRENNTCNENKGLASYLYFYVYFSCFLSWTHFACNSLTHHPLLLYSSIFIYLMHAAIIDVHVPLALLFLQYCSWWFLLEFSALIALL